MKSKPNPLLDCLVSDLIPKRIIDQNSQTLSEMVEQSGQCKTSVSTWLAKNKDKYEKVWKKIGDRTIPSYRIKAIK